MAFHWGFFSFPGTVRDKKSGSNAKLCWLMLVGHRPVTRSCERTISTGRYLFTHTLTSFQPFMARQAVSGYSVMRWRLSLAKYQQGSYKKESGRSQTKSALAILLHTYSPVYRAKKRLKISLIRTAGKVSLYILPSIFFAQRENYQKSSITIRIKFRKAKSYCDKISIWELFTDWRIVAILLPKTNKMATKRPTKHWCDNRLE